MKFLIFFILLSFVPFTFINLISDTQTYHIILVLFLWLVFPLFLTNITFKRVLSPFEMGFFNANHMSFHLISKLTKEYKWDLDSY